MTDWAIQRTKMVDGQVRPNDVTDHRIIAAMLEIPRELFVPTALGPLAYIDRNLELPGGRGLLQPMLVAKAIQAAEIQSGEAVLEVGAGTGYVAAVIARLDAKVTAVESDPVLATAARGALAASGTTGVTVVEGPLPAGAPAGAPYSVILISGSVETIPDQLLDQLADGGRLVVFEGAGLSGRAKLYTRTGADVAGRTLFNASAPALPGFAREPAFVF